MKFHSPRSSFHGEGNSEYFTMLLTIIIQDLWNAPECGRRKLGSTTPISHGEIGWFLGHLPPPISHSCLPMGDRLQWFAFSLLSLGRLFKYTPSPISQMRFPACEWKILSKISINTWPWLKKNFNSRALKRTRIKDLGWTFFNTLPWLKKMYQNEVCFG